MIRGIAVWLVAIFATMFTLPCAAATAVTPAQYPATYTYDSPVYDQPTAHTPHECGPLLPIPGY